MTKVFPEYTRTVSNFSQAIAQAFKYIFDSSCVYIVDYPSKLFCLCNTLPLIRLHIHKGLLGIYLGKL